MKKTVNEVIEELKQISKEIEVNPEIVVELEKAEKAAPKAKEVESEEGGSEGKVKETNPKDAEETSTDKRRKDDQIPGVREITNLDESSAFAKEEECASEEKDEAKEEKKEDKKSDYQMLKAEYMKACAKKETSEKK